MVQSYSINSWLHPGGHFYVGRYGFSASLAQLRYFFDHRLKVTFNHRMKIITVGGTNGKGSTVSVLEQTLVNQGLKVVSNTSPHLLHYNERIKVDTYPINDVYLLELFQRIECCIENDVIGYPQYALLGSCLAACDVNADVLILEVGLGGRLDSANIFDADLSILTSINLDHTHLLGKTRDEIALEKVAIARYGKPLVIGDDHPPQSLYRYIDQYQLDAYFFGQDFWFDLRKLYLKKQQYNFNIKKCHTHPSNIACAMMGLNLLNDQLKIDLKDAVEVANQVQIKGRCQTLYFNQSTVIVDVAHNQHSVQSLYKFLQSQTITSYAKTYAIFSAVETKDITGMLKIMAPIVDQWHCPSLHDIDERGLTLDKLKQTVPESFDKQFYFSLTECFFNVMNKIKPNDRLVIFGSFVISGEFLKFYENLTN
jgi:dihydrofolate synthase/folylpolyglutamate synthase